MRLLAINKKNQELGLFFKIYLIITVLSTLLTYLLRSDNELQSFLFSESLVLIAVLMTSFSIYILFLKKNIALFTGIIVFKWPILIYVVYKWSELADLSQLFFVLGLIPIILSSLIWALIKKE